MKQARTKGQYQLVLCVWLRAALQMNARQVALAVGWTTSAVWKAWSRYRREGEAMFMKPGKGGRRRQYLPAKAEREFLNGLLYQSSLGQSTMDSKFIQESYEKLVGHSVSVSAIHRMLKRHDWRPVSRAQFVMPMIWEPGLGVQQDEVSLYMRTARCPGQIGVSLKNAPRNDSVNPE